MKQRSVAFVIIMSIITCGIYYLYFYIKFQCELKAKTGLGFGGFAHLIVSIFTFGIYTLVWNFKVGGRLEKAGASNQGVAYLLLSLFGLGVIAFGLMQNEANKVA